MSTAMAAPSIFTPRVALKPYEYPDVLKYKEAINHSYWLVSEWNFLSDVHDFNVTLNEVQRNAVKNTLLAISQVEVAVKKFWTKLGDRFPKPEFEQVGVTFGECEVRHADAYSHLLEVLNLNDDFEALLQVPAIKGRVDYLTKYLKGASASDHQGYLLNLTLFSIFTENVSLFSQFAIIKSFFKHMVVLKDIDNIIGATMREEEIHALLGVYLVNSVKEQHPEWFDDEFYNKIYSASRKAYEAEAGIIDWIFEKGELEFLSKDTLKEFIKNRFNESIRMIGGENVFDVNKSKLSELSWFEADIYGEAGIDFFNKKSTAYSKRTTSITASDLF